MESNYIKYCKSCGNQIPVARVKIVPHTLFCVGCAEGKVSKKLAISILDGDIDHGATTIKIVEGFDTGYSTNVSLLETEPEMVAPDPKQPLSIPKRNEFINEA